MIRVRVSGSTFRTLFMARVKVRVRVTSGRDAIINGCIVARIKLEPV